MKPRRESAVLTRDDTKIWLNFNLPMRRKAPHPLQIRAYFESDRRDAELMLTAQVARAHGSWDPIAINRSHAEVAAMKPLPTAPLTEEDYAIWNLFADPGINHEPVNLYAYWQSDRRDAELMLRAVEWRYIPLRDNDPFGYIRPEAFPIRIDSGELIDCGGYHEHPT